MSTSSRSRSDGDNSFDVGELLEIGTRCRELRIEKDMLRESQSQSFKLVRGLELYVKSLSEACIDDKKRIQELERVLMNCSQEIDFLQDQLNSRNEEVNSLEEYVHSLELKLADTGNLREKVVRLREELKRSNSECLFLTRKLESKELELEKSNLCKEKLEESILSVALESQCEIESMKLDVMALENTCYEAKKIQEETLHEKAQMNGLIQELEVRFQESQKIIECLDKENKELREKLDTSERNSRVFCEKIEEWLENKRSQFSSQSSLTELDGKLSISRKISTCGEIFSPLLSELATVLAPDADSNGKMSNQIREYQFLVKQLKEELREEKLKSKEEAEDLAQEMAELRYQITGLLEEECKRRACIEQASLQRIAELEAQVQKERGNSSAAVSQPYEA